MKKLTLTLMIAIAPSAAMAANTAPAKLEPTNGTISVPTSLRLQSIQSLLTQISKTQVDAYSHLFYGPGHQNTHAFINTSNVIISLMNSELNPAGTYTPWGQSIESNYACNLGAAMNSNFCTDNPTEENEAVEEYAGNNSAALMEAPSAQTNTSLINNKYRVVSRSQQYINSVLNAINSKDKLASSLPGVSAVYNSLNQISLTHQPGPKGKPSQMNALKSAVNAPFTAKYHSSLEQAGLLQTVKMGSVNQATNNEIAYRQLQLSQQQMINQANILSQQMRTNQLLAKNLAATNQLIQVENKVLAQMKQNGQKSNHNSSGVQVISSDKAPAEKTLSGGVEI